MRRPLRVTLIALAVLLLAAANLARSVQALKQAEYMRDLGLEGVFFALTATGAIWTAGFGAAGVGLLKLKRWARVWALAAIVLYQSNLWIIRLVFEKSEIDISTRPADAVISILSILLVWAILFTSRARRAFERGA